MNPIEVYDRCISGKPYSKELKIYTKKYLNKVLYFLISTKGKDFNYNDAISTQQ